MQGVGIVPVFPFVPSVSITYPEVIVTSSLYSVGYRAHGGAVVAVFFSGLSVAQDRGGHKTLMHGTATT